MGKFFRQAREPMNSFTHFVGALLSILATVLLISRFFTTGETNFSTLFSVVVFGLSLTALYSSSSYYHYFRGDKDTQKWLRKLDHSMIYVLIAGTYTPIVLRFMNHKSALFFITIIWTVALLGILLKLCFPHAKRFLSTAIYLLMGWAIVFDLDAFLGIPSVCLLLIALGGISYSVGAVFYILKKPNLSQGLGFHELFHLLIILGSFFHFLSIYLYVL